MDIAGVAEMAMTMKRAEFAQELGIQMIKQSLAQDAAVLQIVAAATQTPVQPVAAPSGGAGAGLDISV